MLLDIPIKECNVDGHIKKRSGCLPQSASFKVIELDFLTFKLVRSHGPSCKSWRCSMQLLFHFSCLDTINHAQWKTCPTVSHIVIISFFVVLRRYLSFHGFSSLDRLEIAPTNSSNARCTKFPFQQVFICPKRIPIEGVMPIFSCHCNLPCADFSTCISDVCDIAPPVGLQLYRS